MTPVRRAAAGDVAGVAHVHAAAWRDTYPGILPEDVIARFDEARRMAHWSAVVADPAHASHLFVATGPDGGVTGFGACGPGRDGPPGAPGEFMALYVGAAARGRGTGRALMRAMAADLLERGLSPAFLCVLVGNDGAIGFYERLGGRLAELRPTTVGGHPCDERIYLWPDPGVLVRD